MLAPGRSHAIPGLGGCLHGLKSAEAFKNFNLQYTEILSIHIFEGLFQLPSSAILPLAVGKVRRAPRYTHVRSDSNFMRMRASQLPRPFQTRTHGAELQLHRFRFADAFELAAGDVRPLGGHGGEGHEERPS